MQAAFAFWICCCAYLNCIGWILSGLHQLNGAGYAVALLPGLLATFLWLKRSTPLRFKPRFGRYRRPLPGIFLFCAVLIFLGGALHAPNNYDALTYRLPRMLNWWTAGQWHWLSTFNHRMNYSGVGWEWTAMPLLTLTHSDRALFLINALGYLLLPGLLFSVFRQLGVRRRVAWTWMWVLPLAFGYAVQAGSIGNDLFGALFGLLSVYFGLRARKSGRISDIWLMVLAAALMTAVKLSNLPLALPCLVAAWPALGRLRKDIAATLAVGAVAVLVSALPIMAANQWYAGSWTGDPNNKDQMQIKSPAAALLGNSFLVAEQAFMPPLLPSRKMDETLIHHLPASWRQLLVDKYPRFFLTHFTEMPGEENAGLGLGITLLLLAGSGATVVLALRRGWQGGNPFPAVVAAAGISTAVYLLKMGSEAAPRLMLSYYPLAIMPLLLLPGQYWLLRQRLYRWLPILAALAVLPALVLSVSRPLWPAVSVSGHVAQTHPGSRVAQRMAATYETYAHRNDLLAPIRSQLPDQAREIGFIAGSNDTDYSLWRPFGQRQVIYLRQSAGDFLAHPEKTEWLVVKANQWSQICPLPLAQWAQTNHFDIVFSTNIVELVSWGPEEWALLHRQK